MLQETDRKRAQGTPVMVREKEPVPTLPWTRPWPPPSPGFSNTQPEACLSSSTTFKSHLSSLEKKRLHVSSGSRRRTRGDETPAPQSQPLGQRDHRGSLTSSCWPHGSPWGTGWHRGPGRGSCFLPPPGRPATPDPREENFEALPRTQKEPPTHRRVACNSGHRDSIKSGQHSLCRRP